MSHIQFLKDTKILGKTVMFGVSKDGLWINATQVAKQYGKNLTNYWIDEAGYIAVAKKLNLV